MNKILLLSALLLVMSGCSNPYTQFYTDYMKGKDVLENPMFIITSSEPELIIGSNIEQDRLRMFEKGYVLLGVSSFNGADINPRSAIEQAKKVHADTVIAYREYTNTRSGSVPLTLPDTQTTYHSGSIYGSEMSASYFGSSTTYGSKTTYIPYSVDRHDYFATFWLKAKPPRLGIIFRNLTPQQRSISGTNKGACIGAVVKNSPAFKADLVPGDVVATFNNIEVIDAEHLSSILDSCNARTIRLEMLRQGKRMVKEVTLSTSFYPSERVSAIKSSKPVELPSDSGAPEPEALSKPEPQADVSDRQIKGYKLKRDASGEPAKDKSGSFIFIPVYEED